MFGFQRLCAAGLSEEEAVKLAETRWWEDKPLEHYILVQFFVDRLCMPLSVYRRGVNILFGRSVYCHELASSNYPSLLAELDGRRKPSFQAILELVPKEKRAIVLV